VLLRGLERHAEEFHRRRLEAARDQGHDLAADAVGYDLDDLHQRFPGLSRYGGLDAATASLLIGEIREGRFFDDDSLVPTSSYVFRKESLAFVLGLYLIQELTQTLRERRLQLTLNHLRERLEMMGPMPGTVIRRSQAASCATTSSISADKRSMRSSSPRQSPARSSIRCTMRGDSTSERLARAIRCAESGTPGAPQCRAPTGRHDLIDDAGTLPDQPLAHAVQSLQVELMPRGGEIIEIGGRG
jgi:hypothetical protein